MKYDSKTRRLPNTTTTFYIRHVHRGTEDDDRKKRQNRRKCKPSPPNLDTSSSFEQLPFGVMFRSLSTILSHKCRHGICCAVHLRGEAGETDISRLIKVLQKRGSTDCLP